ncbi:hypothetical protein A0H81_10489 [Grifola frondosa]|uniref:Uncharacterized protein n=1 Tax=Grifola frondosa TaxID=5627 RepID=A0A1C7LYK0_GRIFR|nr:hypothetical protein A0H81_10489 [Grifola frondosa]
MDIASFRRMCLGIFSASYPTAQQNRQAGITCRTWVTHVLSRILAPQRAKEIERMVTTRSTTCGNQYATDFLLRREYTVPVEDLV